MITTTLAPDVSHYRALVAALSRDRKADDPDLLAARANLAVARQTHAALVVLDNGVEARNGSDPAQMVDVVQGSKETVALRLLEAVEMLAYLIRLSDRPDELLAALRERVTATGTD